MPHLIETAGFNLISLYLLSCKNDALMLTNKSTIWRHNYSRVPPCKTSTHCLLLPASLQYYKSCGQKHGPSKAIKGSIYSHRYSLWRWLVTATPQFLPLCFNKHPNKLWPKFPYNQLALSLRLDTLTNSFSGKVNVLPWTICGQPRYRLHKLKWTFCVLFFHMQCSFVSFHLAGYARCNPLCPIIHYVRHNSNRVLWIQAKRAHWHIKVITITSIWNFSM